MAEILILYTNTTGNHVVEDIKEHLKKDPSLGHSSSTMLSRCKETRRHLREALTKLPGTLFEELLFDLDVPRGLLSSVQSPQAYRVRDLLDWAENSKMNRLGEVIAALNKISSVRPALPVSERVGSTNIDLDPFLNDTGLSDNAGVFSKCKVLIPVLSKSVEQDLEDKDSIRRSISTILDNAEKKLGSEFRNRICRKETAVLAIFISSSGDIDNYPKENYNIDENYEAAIVRCHTRQAFRTDVRKVIERVRKLREKEGFTEESFFVTPELEANLEQYRNEVRLCLNDEGEISGVSQIYLDFLRDRLSIKPEYAENIEDEILLNCRNYKDLYEKMVQVAYPLDEVAENHLNRLRKRLSLDSSKATRFKMSVLKGDDLVAEKYIKLRLLLRGGRWIEADKETYTQLFDAFERPNKLFICPSDVENIPCHDFTAIDRLWQKYSKGKFGFSSQYKCFRQANSESYSCEVDHESWRSFCAKVGWKKNGYWVNLNTLSQTEANFPESLSEGFFPAWISWWGTRSDFASALAPCLMLKISKLL